MQDEITSSQELMLSQDLPFSQDDFGDYFSSSLEVLSQNVLKAAFSGNVDVKLEQEQQDPNPTVDAVPVQIEPNTNIPHFNEPACPPPSNNWAGDYQFDVFFEPPAKMKGLSWTYSGERDKLYVGKDLPCCINFIANPPPPEGSRIRVAAVYSQPEHVKDSVRRCCNHMLEDQCKGVTSAEHFVRCNCQQAVYEIDCATGQLSVEVPYETPSFGQFHCSHIFKFSCYSSCLSRRATKVIFTLESNNEVVGRRSVDLKICACPLRDCRNDDKQDAKLNSDAKIAIPNISIKHKLEKSGELSSSPKKSKRKRHQFVTQEDVSTALETACGGMSSQRNGLFGSSSRFANDINNYPGDYGFGIRIDQDKSRGATYIYSKERDKLYVSKDSPCAISFFSTRIVPCDARIRVSAVFSQPEHASEVVERCHHHYISDTKNGVHSPNHLIRCESDCAVYETDSQTGHLSVVVPFQNPQRGQDYSVYIFKFVCYGSCPGGLNRRPVKVIFSLEHWPEVIGCRSLSVKICACPARDCRNDDQQMNINNSAGCSKKKKKTDSAPNVQLGEGNLSSHFLDLFRFVNDMNGSLANVDMGPPYTCTTDDIEEYEFLKQIPVLCDSFRALNTIFNMEGVPRTKEESSNTDTSE